MTPLSEEAVQGLDSAIRSVVLSLRAHGFNTTDSGDGSKAGTMEGALDIPHVFATTGPDAMIREADRLLYWLIGHGSDEGVRAARVEATYLPQDAVAMLALFHVTGSSIVVRCARCQTCRSDVMLAMERP